MTVEEIKNSLRNGPNDKGYYGDFGGRYAPEILMPNLIELEEAFELSFCSRSLNIRLREGASFGRYQSYGRQRKASELGR